jgi:acetolactate synthase regulatory subunit
MLVRVGQASVQVDSLEAGISRVRDMARRTGAIIANTSMEDGKEQTRAASLELRIPSEHFDEAVNGLSPIGKLESVNVNVQDVGEEYVDVQARMVNARRLEQRLIDLLANRTGKLTDVLRVEGELARVREEIERYEGRMRYLRSRSSVSTLTVAIHEAYPIVAEHAGSHPMRDAFAQAGRNFIGLTAAVIASLGVLVPIGVLVGAVLFLARRFLATHGLRLPEKASGSERA